MKTKITVILCYAAAICFLIAYIYRRENIYIVLGVAWLCIGTSNIFKIKDR